MEIVFLSLFLGDTFFLSSIFVHGRCSSSLEQCQHLFDPLFPSYDDEFTSPTDVSLCTTCSRSLSTCLRATGRSESVHLVLHRSRHRSAVLEYYYFRSFSTSRRSTCALLSSNHENVLGEYEEENLIDHVRCILNKCPI